MTTLLVDPVSKQYMKVRTHNDRTYVYPTGVTAKVISPAKPVLKRERPYETPVTVYHTEPETYESLEPKLSGVPKTYNICESPEPSGREANKPAVVYWITDGEFVKVGYTTDLAKRLATLQTGNARKLEVLRVKQFATATEAYKYEQYVHKTMSTYRVRGEWFTITR